MTGKGLRLHIRLSRQWSHTVSSGDFFGFFTSSFFASPFRAFLFLAEEAAAGEAEAEAEAEPEGPVRLGVDWGTSAGGPWLAGEAAAETGGTVAMKSEDGSSSVFILIGSWSGGAKRRATGVRRATAVRYRVRIRSVRTARKQGSGKKGGRLSLTHDLNSRWLRASH